MLSLFGFALFIAALVFLASKIKFEEDITKLIPSNSKTREVQRVLRSVNFTDKIIVNVHRQSIGSVEDLTKYAAQFVDSIEKNLADYVKNIQGKVDEDAIDATLDFLYQNVPLFLDELDYKTITNRIQKDSIEAITQANFKTLMSPSGIVAKKSILRDPLGISFIGLKKLEQLGIGDRFTLKDGFLLSKDEKNVLLFITPTFPSSETDKNEAFAESLYRLQEQLNEEFNGKIDSEYFGAVLIAVANAQQIKKDIQFTVGIALTILILIFIFFYRKLTIPLILFAPTFFGGLMSVAFLYLIRTEISAISLGIGSVLLGVTLDYSLHILTHIRNNESIRSLYRDISKPILMSSLTTAMAFLCLLFLDSQALQDLGIFAAVSVLGASVFALLFIPQVYRGGVQKNKKPNVLDKIARHNFHKNKWAIGLVVGLLVVSLFTYNKVIFNKDISKLNFEPPAATKAKENLDTLTNLASKSIYLAAFGNTTEIALKANDTVFKKLQELENEKAIISFSSVGTLMYSEEIQKQKIARWKSFWQPETIALTKDYLVESGRSLGFKTSTYNRFYTQLEAEFYPLEPKDYRAISTFSIDDFITQDSDFTTITSLVKVDEVNVEKVRTAFNNNSNILAIDRQEMNETLLGI